MDSSTKKYYEKLATEVWKQYEVAKNARAKGYDPSTEVECKPVSDLAQRAETIVGLKGLAKRYREIIKEKPKRIEAIFQIFEEIIKQKWIEIPDLEKRIELAIKAGLVLITEGVVVSPLDGLPKICISKNYDGSKYVDIYFAGPIRAAGGSATVMPLILGDYARKLLGLERYKPTKEEVERYVEEITLYQERLARQYRLTEEEIRIIIQGCPVCINGVPTEEQEVSTYRDLERIPTNRIRGGMCLVVSEGIALKAMKILKWANYLGLDWSWLEKIIKVEKTAEKVEIKPNEKYLEGMAAGRPVLAYPSMVGGFRLRYGRCRNTGCMAKGIHPALMYLLDEFIAVGTHVKVERPGKAAQLFPCNSIEPPIVKLKDGSVIKVKTIEEATKIRDDVEKILFLGDMLVAVGDFRKSAHPLLKSPYVEEWWLLEAKEAAKKKNIALDGEIIKTKGLNLNFDKAIELSEKLNLPLHPKFIFYYKNLKKDDILKLSNAVRDAETRNGLMLLDKSVKEILEKILVEHKVEGDMLLISNEDGKALWRTFYNSKNVEEIVKSKEDILEILSEIAGVRIMDKCGSFIGARMGRPEQAREREMKGKPQVLFPVGWYGGNQRSIQKAIEYLEKTGKKLRAEVVLFQCPKCKELLIFPYCRKCNSRAVMLRECPSCHRLMLKEECSICKKRTLCYNEREINLKEMFEEAVKHVGKVDNVKGVKGLMSGKKIPEMLEKGILRAKYNLHVFRDGTCRFELLNAPLTHFKPKEINVSVEKLRELGYEKDINGNELVDENQMVELKPQDVIVNENAGEWLLRMSKFIDELLEKVYGLEAYFKAESKEDLIGQLIVCLAPHTSAGIVGRVIGFSKTRLGWGHPYFFMATRRNFDGDQNSIMLLMDALLNFSISYLADKSGGKMDAPLVITIALDPTEIDDEVYEMEVCKEYPLEFYYETLKNGSPFIESVPTVGKKLSKEDQYINFFYTHETDNFCKGPIKTAYVKLKTMEEKILAQDKLQKRIAAVNAKDALERVLSNHFLPDIIGNARAFSRQKFRCTKCNSKYRRIPLNGKCSKCGNELILTIAEGTVKKYLEIAKKIVSENELSTYITQRIALIEEEVNTIFRKMDKRQRSLSDFFSLIFFLLFLLLMGLPVFFPG